MKQPLVLKSRSKITRLLIEIAQHDFRYQGVEAQLRKGEGSTATYFPGDWIEKGAEMSGEKLFHLQTMEGRQRESEDD